MLKIKKVSHQELEQLSVDVYRKRQFCDSRGSLNLDFEGKIPFPSSSVSIKTSKSIKGVARGLHHQRIDSPQTKIISVLEGAIIDFIYDPHGEENTVYFFDLHQNDQLSIAIPPKYAHGFICKTEVVFQYLCIGEYSESAEDVYNILQCAAPLVGIGDVILSEKDASKMPIAVYLG